MKDLVYLNLAMNNIRQIDGLQSCEKLRKLDLTLNFVDLVDLHPGLRNLQANEFLAEM